MNLCCSYAVHSGLKSLLANLGLVLNHPKQTSHWQGFLWFQQSRKYHWQLLCVKWLVIKECMAISTIKKLVIQHIYTYFYGLCRPQSALSRYCHEAVLGVGVLAVNKPPDCTSNLDITWIRCNFELRKWSKFVQFFFLWKKIGLHLLAFSSTSWMGVVVICTATGFSFFWFPSLVPILLSDRLHVIEPRPS